jgi:hypothetical protein
LLSAFFTLKASAHEAGSVGKAFVEMINPAKAKRLRSIFDQIQWP